MNYYGFNFLWMVSKKTNIIPSPPDQKALDFLVKQGFNFVRIPCDYRLWTSHFDYFHPDENVLKTIDAYLEACRSRGLHLSLNLHRAPGYCINGNHLEKDNLWIDETAQDAFIFLWETFAVRYKGVSKQHLSFDLINEPPNLGQYGLTRQNHEALIRRVVNTIRTIDTEREIIINGLGGGNLAIPELADLDVTHSGRGYQPMPVTHYKADWWPDYAKAPEPCYPDLDWEGCIWNRQTLMNYYRPWIDLNRQGTRIHIGECGCFDKTPNAVALNWFSDLFSIYKEQGWGYALWNFEGPFGIIGHHRQGGRFTKMDGYLVDQDLLELLLTSRVE